MVSLPIKRVVSIFILRPNKTPPPPIRPQRQRGEVNNAAHQIALFRRCDTMPTFPGHWAGISGSIEEDDAGPMEAAARELREETNLGELFQKHYDGNDEDLLRAHMKRGLHVDVSSRRSKGAFDGRMIRVYPIALTLPEIVDGFPSEEVVEDKAALRESTTVMATCSSLWSNIEMKGTEHDEMKFMDIHNFLESTDPCVPALKLAFHHATFGSYLELPKEIRSWEQDRANGAAFLARRAVTLAAAHVSGVADGADDDNEADDEPGAALSIAMLRPSMVPIVNVMKEFDLRTAQPPDEDPSDVEVSLLQSLEDEVERCVELGVETVLRLYEERRSKDAPSSADAAAFVVGTFSRSSTLKSILVEVLRRTCGRTTKVKVECSQSAPGEEGELMSSDVPGAHWFPDESFRQRIEDGEIDMVLVGADCVLPGGKGVVNKVGTAALAECCKRCRVPIICCADRWKLWEDEYVPGLEDIFELLPCDLLDGLLVPS